MKNKKCILWLLSFTAYFFLVSCSLIKSGSQDEQPALFVPSDTTIVIRDVAVIPVSDTGVEEHQTIILFDGKIQEIIDAGEAEIPQSAVIIEGAGKFLMPGVLDMHVHMHAEDLSQYLSHGITTVRNMWGTPDIKRLISQIREDNIVGPEIYSASPGIDGTPPTWGYTQEIEDPEEATELVKRLKNEGWPFLKVYNRLNPDVYKAIVNAANSENVRFLGHAPFAIPIEDVLDAGQASVEHFTGYDRHLGGSQGFNAWRSINQSRIPAIAEMTATTDTWNCPTLVVLDELTKQNLDVAFRETTEKNRFKLLKALYDRGAKLLVGTDAGINLTTPGTSLYDEMKKFVQAGIPPYEVIRLATLEGAKFLGIDDQIGTVSVGKQADLILLKENPLEKIDNISTLEGVILDGTWYPKQYFED